MKKRISPEKILLMIPGPSKPEPEVLAALTLPVMAHYGNQWARLYEDTLSKLQLVFKTKNEVILLPAPGQSAVEMAVGSLLKKGEEAFVCSNGFFANMISDTLRAYGVKPLPIKAPLGKPIGAEDVKATVQSVPKSKERRCLFLVHNETSTGLTNPATEIMKVCEDEGLVSILDAISGFGGIDIRTDEWKVDYCIGYSSKAIGGIFGVTPISISKECWNLAKKKETDRGRFLSLNVWRHYIDEWSPIGHPHPSTMPTNIIAALNTALGLVLREGLSKRFRRHQHVARKLEESLESIGLNIFPMKKYASNTVTAVNTDPKVNSHLRRRLLDDYGILIADGLGSLSGKIIRIGHMGTSATQSATNLTLCGIREILESIPHSNTHK